MAFVTSIKLPLPCIRGSYGPHLQSFQTICPPSQIVSLIGHDPRSSNWKTLAVPLREAYETYQRRTKNIRSEGINRYIRDRMTPSAKRVGAFPSLSIGITETPLFEPLRGRAGVEIQPGVQIDENIGTLYLDIGVKPRMLLDGLARLTAAMDCVDQGNSDVDQWFSFALTIFGPSEKKGTLTPAELGQLFYDFNYLVTPVSPTLALSMDQAGVYSQIVEWLKDQPVIADNGGMQASGASLGAKSTALVVRRVLHGFVTVAAEGEKALSGAKNAEIRGAITTEDNIQEVRERIDFFLNCFAEAMGDRFTDRDSIHLTRIGWEAIGIIAHDVAVRNKISEDQVRSVTARLAAIDWSRVNRQWFGMIGHADQDKEGNLALDEQGRERVIISGGKGDQGLKRCIAFLRKKTGVQRKATDSSLPRFENEGDEAAEVEEAA